jgi:hypothetical protein
MKKPDTMKWLSAPHALAQAGLLAFAVAALAASFFTNPGLAAATADERSSNLGRMNCGAQVECIMPDGTKAPMVTGGKKNDHAAAVVIMEDDTIRCPLKEGVTTFIVSLPGEVMVDRFSFINENAAARGELKIAVSNCSLPPASSEWKPVEGNIAFNRKRLFNLSLLGVDAKFLKLTFRVDSEAESAATGREQANSAWQVAAARPIAL